MAYTYQYENGPTITVFAPYDCKNNCPFCVTKKDYAEHSAYCNHSVSTVMSQMCIYGNVHTNCDFVITGGEPFADLNKLDMMIKTIRYLNANGHNHKLFINTTLPASTGEEKIIKFIDKNTDIITGINVSRHARKYVQECDDAIFEKINVPVRINTVLYTAEEANEAYKVVERYSNYDCIDRFQMREDYNDVTFDSLYEIENNEVFANIVNAFNPTDNLQQFFVDNAVTVDNFRWNCRITDMIDYHKTLPFSTVYLGGKFQINDILITPSGKVMDDWNEYGKQMKIDDWKNAEFRSAE